MVLLHPGLNPEPVWEFDADIMILNAHSTLIRPGYQPVIHINNVRQVATIVSVLDVVRPVPKTTANNASDASNTNVINTSASTTSAVGTCDTTAAANIESSITNTSNNDVIDNPKSHSLKTGDRAKVHFRFGFHPEWIETGSRLIFREGKTKGFGIINKIYDYGSTRVASDLTIEERLQRCIRKQNAMKK